MNDLTAAAGLCILVSTVLASSAPAGASTPGRKPRTLTKDALVRAEDFLERSARPIDRLRFELSFRTGDASRVLAELAKYQNPDGGFGRGLEPDLRCAASSRVATIEGLTIASEAGAGADDPVARAAVGYLMSTFDSGKGYWSAVPAEVASAPHAPWWHPDPASGKAPAETPVYPTAGVLALLYRYPERVPPELLERATANLLAHLRDAPDKMDAGAIVALVRLAERVPEPNRAALVARTRQAGAASVARRRSDWPRYGLTPLTAAESPGSLLHPGLEREVQDNLDYLLETQDADGGWSPTWSWEKTDAAAWAQARSEWRGVLTLENLRRLRAFGRLPAR